MFLSNLNEEKKKLFLDLSIYAAKADELIEKEEKAIINAHCAEMGINNNDYRPIKTLDDVLKKLYEKCAKEEINMIILEIMAVILADDKYSKEEKEFTNKIKEYFRLENERFNKACEILTRLKGIYKDMNNFIIDK